MRVLGNLKEDQARKLMQKMQVDPYGIKIMLPKSQGFLIQIRSLNNICANILKQEMLSLGGDVAVARGALTGRIKKTDCLLIGDLAQLNRLKDKLKKQPFGLNSLADELKTTLENYAKERFTLNLKRSTIRLGVHPCIMGILNLTPDSFSGDGLYGKERNFIYSALEHALMLAKDGADILDIGGESTRPGAKTISLKEELRRTIPLINRLCKKTNLPVSIDTYKPEVARQALDNGATIVNDITGLKDLKMAKIVARYKAGIVIMHMKGRPCNMQHHPKYEDVVSEIADFLEKGVDKAKEAGINDDKIIIDPGIGFGKRVEDNLAILNRLNEFKSLGKPIMVGVSRKSFIGTILGVPAHERLAGTISSCVLAVDKGAKILRVHDVLAIKQALSIQDAINKWN